MKPVPLALLLASVLLASHIRPGAARPRFDGAGHSFQSQLDEVLLRAAGDSAASYLLGEKMLKFLHRDPRVGSASSPGRLPEFVVVDEGLATSRGALAHLARSLVSSLESRDGEGVERVPSAEEAAEYRHAGGLGDLAALTKRNDEPPISIDLTFHLLRNMIEMAKIESQKEQAELNRKFLEEVGK